MSGAPGKIDFKLFTFGNSRSRRAIIHRTVRCTPDSVRCSAKIHRTCPVYTGLSGVTAGQRLLQAPTATCSALNARQRAQGSDTPMLAHRTPYSSCLVRHRSSRRAQRQSSNGRNPNVRVTWLAHRTCPVCTRLSGAPCDRQPPPKRLVWWLGLQIPPTTPHSSHPSFPLPNHLQELDIQF
jgi:hypothetical protein